jgi:hypothetical protein
MEHLPQDLETAALVDALDREELARNPPPGPIIAEGQEEWVEVREDDYGGGGLFTKRVFLSGERVLEERPLALETFTGERGNLAVVGRLLTRYPPVTAEVLDRKGMRMQVDITGRSDRYKDALRRLSDATGAPLGEVLSLERIANRYVIRLLNLATHSSSGQVLALRACMTNHSCEPNTVYTLDPSTGNLSLYALCRIEDGEEVTVPYYWDLMGDSWVTRGSVIASNQHFECLCKRCKDEEEATGKEVIDTHERDMALYLHTLKQLGEGYAVRIQDASDRIDAYNGIKDVLDAGTVRLVFDTFGYVMAAEANTPSLVRDCAHRCLRAVLRIRPVRNLTKLLEGWPALPHVPMSKGSHTKAHARPSKLPDWMTGQRMVIEAPRQQKGRELEVAFEALVSAAIAGVEGMCTAPAFIRNYSKGSSTPKEGTEGAARTEEERKPATLPIPPSAQRILRLETAGLLLVVACSFQSLMVPALRKPERRAWVEDTLNDPILVPILRSQHIASVERFQDVRALVLAP